MKKIDTDELLNQLEQTYVLLKEDTQALTYLYDKYFSYITPGDDFVFNYKEIQNYLEILSKSLKYNLEQTKQAINDIYSKM